MQAIIKGCVITNANPEGCHQYLRHQWQRLNEKPAGEKHLSVLIIGASSGFGLASRLAALRNGATFSVGVSYERAPNEAHSGSAGWHLNQAFNELAAEQSHTAVTLNADAFLKETKDSVIQAANEAGVKFDLVVYSVAAGIKLNAAGEKVRSSILPVGKPLKGLQVDLVEHKFTEMELPPANQQQIDDTVYIMGGDDWEDWMHALKTADVLKDSCKTYNYSYLGGELNAPIYREGTLGAAKEHMHLIASELRDAGFNARAVVCKALVTKASLFIPLMAPYLMALRSELVARNQEEDVFEQMYRLLSGGAIEDGDLLRLDNFELQDDVQAGIEDRINRMTPTQFKEVIDYEGVRQELLAMHGF